LEDGAIVYEFKDIKVVAMADYVDIYTQSKETNPYNVNVILYHISPIVTREDNSILSHPIFKFEIFTTIWNLEPDKSPGPDGFSISFYRYF
jgi:hypothetical protein